LEDYREMLPNFSVDMQERSLYNYILLFPEWV